jgi:hypothetical protein
VVVSIPCTSLYEANRELSGLRDALMRERSRAEHAEARATLLAPMRDILRRVLAMTRGPRDESELVLLRRASDLVAEGQ